MIFKIPSDGSGPLRRAHSTVKRATRHSKSAPNEGGRRSARMSDLPAEHGIAGRPPGHPDHGRAPASRGTPAGRLANIRRCRYGRILHERRGCSHFTCTPVPLGNRGRLAGIVSQDGVTPDPALRLSNAFVP
ncbi:hypothetical protein Maq22A_c28615 [Methylobacterium aquaticum]|uniref:Uncharacterized protein n=1 Tax=Methylobacterium aquaticum TaxID=270351 RepID=A0A1Y0Z8S9_9HYPH|nr:hypothetical protein Maq22A_c28615 [Methylobacterium aquaticum]